MCKAYKPVFYHNEKEAFFCLLAELPQSGEIISRRTFELENDYQQAYIGDEFYNLSFCVVENDQPLALVLLHYSHKKLHYCLEAVSLHIPSYDKDIIVFCIETIVSLATTHQAHTISFKDTSMRMRPSLLGEKLFNFGATPHLQLNAIIDLTQNEEILRQNLRKSYKSLVNQGLREMTFETVNHKTYDAEKFYRFQEFHKKISGKSTRSQTTWDIQLQMIKEGLAELILGYKEGYGLVSSALFEDKGNTSVYSVAVYERELFDYPLAHANVFQGILNAKKRGLKFMNLGIIPTARSVSEKEYTIGKFKKGFTDSLTLSINWQLTLQEQKHDT